MGRSAGRLRPPHRVGGCVDAVRPRWRGHAGHDHRGRPTARRPTPSLVRGPWRGGAGVAAAPVPSLSLWRPGWSISSPCACRTRGRLRCFWLLVIVLSFDDQRDAPFTADSAVRARSHVLGPPGWASTRLEGVRPPQRPTEGARHDPRLAAGSLHEGPTSGGRSTPSDRLRGSPRRPPAVRSTRSAPWPMPNGLLVAPTFDCLVLDRLVPDGDAVSLVGEIDRQPDRPPVLMISGLGDAAERLGGLISGADDYMVKPFLLDELALRVRKLVDAAPSSAGVLQLGRVRLDRHHCNVTCDGTRVPLTPMQFRLLELLATTSDQRSRPTSCTSTAGTRMPAPPERRPSAHVAAPAEVRGLLDDRVDARSGLHASDRHVRILLLGKEGRRPRRSLDGACGETGSPSTRRGRSREAREAIEETRYDCIILDR